MKKALLLILCLSLLIPLAGCIKTYTYQVERKDQDIVGNRGIMKGEIPPPVTGRKRTRTMGGVDVELPPPEEYKAKKETLEGKAAPKEPVRKEAKKKVVKKEVVVKEEVAAEEVREEPVAKEEKKVAVARLEIPEEKPKGFADEQWVKRVEVEEIERKTPPAVEIRYTIQEGDTLGKIAFKFLGDSSRWPEIYEANKEVIKDPARIHPGQVIIIPQIEIEEEKMEGAYK